MTKTLLILSLLLGSLPYLHAEQLRYLKYTESILALPEENRFETHIQAHGTVNSTTSSTIELPYDGTQNLDELYIFYQNKIGRTKKIKGEKIIRDYYKDAWKNTGEMLFFHLPPEARRFNFSYKKIASPLLLLAQFPLFVEVPTDTLEYIFQKESDTHSFLFQCDDSYKKGKFTAPETGAISFQILSPKVHTKPPTTTTIRSTSKRPYLLVGMKSGTKDQYQEFAEKYLAFIRPSQEISEETLAQFKTLVEGKSGKELVQTIYKAVRNKSSYWEDKIGISAILPQKAENFWQAKYGDCKDISNFLYTVFAKLGYEPSLILTSTNDHHYQDLFPSLGAFNHLAMLVKVDGISYFLDATSKDNDIGMPLRYTQGQMMLNLSTPKDLKQKIPVFPKEKNTALFSYQGKLAPSHQGFSGQFQIELEGYAATEIKQQLQAEKPLESILGIRNIEDNSPIFTPRMTNQWRPTKVMQEHNDNIYLPLGFLPPPHLYPARFPAGYLLDFPHTLDKQFEISLDFERPISLKIPPPVSFSKDGLGFTFEIQQKDPNTLYISYQFTNDHLLISDDLAESYYEINQLVLQTFKTVLIIE